MTGQKLQRRERPTGHRHNVPHRLSQPEENPKRGARDTLTFVGIWHTTFQTRERIGIRRRELIPSQKPHNLLIMSDMQKYIDICNEKAEQRASEMRGLANSARQRGGQHGRANPRRVAYGKEQSQGKSNRHAELGWSNGRAVGYRTSRSRAHDTAVHHGSQGHPRLS